MPDNNIRFYNLDFLKFIFTIAIVLLHISASNQQVDFYKNVYEHVDRSYLIVEFFFMVSGFFLYFEIQKENIQTFIKKRIIRLLPVIIFSLICGYIFISGKHKENILFSLLFLQGMGLQAPFYFHWFVSPLFWGSILYFFIFTNYKRTTATFFVAVLCYLSYCLLLNNNNGNIDIHVGMIKGFLSGSLLRALGGIGIGYFLGLSYDKFPLPNNLSFKQKLFLNIIEIFTFCYLIHRLLLKKGAIRNDFIFIVFFAILIYAMVNRKGMISYLFNRLKFSNIYKTSYSIYIMQGIGFFITTQILAFFDMTRNDVWTMLFEMVVCILLGVITYLGVEKRATRYFRDKYDI